MACKGCKIRCQSKAIEVLLEKARTSAAELAQSKLKKLMELQNVLRQEQAILAQRELGEQFQHQPISGIDGAGQDEVNSPNTDTGGNAADQFTKKEFAS